MADQTVQTMLDKSLVPIDNGSKKAIDRGTLAVSNAVLNQAAFEPNSFWN